MKSAGLHLSLVLLFALLSLSLAADERILHYQSDIRVQESGALTITERIRVRAEGREIRRGIYRDFPTRYRDRWGNRVTAGFDPVSVRRDGAAESWHSEQQSNGVRVYFGRADRMLEHGVHEYEFVFHTNRQLGYFSDHDELYFNAIGHGWTFPIDHGEVTITFPFAVPEGQLKTDVYTGAQDARAADARVTAVGDRSVHIETTQPLPPRHGLTVAVAWPKGLTPEPGLLQKSRWFLADNAAALVLLLGLLAPLAWYLWAWNRVGRDPEKGVIIPRFEAPEGLSPAACSYVSRMSFGNEAFTAAIISLAVKKQLLIEESDEEFTLQRPADAPAEALTAGERAVRDTLLPAPRYSLRMDNANHRDFQAARDALRQALKKEYLGRLFHLNTVFLMPPVLMSIAAGLLALLFTAGPFVWVSYALLTLALHGLFLYLLRAPTPAGRRVMDEIEGLRMYLGTAERDRLDRMRSPRLTPEVFESFLPYAYALGVENAWCQRFASEMPREVREQQGYHPRWYSGEFHGSSALAHLGEDFGGAFTSAVASASSPPGSSSGSGGGGSSGGGGGGGGGGGW